MKPTPRLHIVLPVMNESAFLPGFLASLQQQRYRDWELTVCVNQYDGWWEMPEKKDICEDNRKSLALLQQWKQFPVTLIDRSSPGKGWSAKKGGVGHARKTVMDAVAARAGDHDIMVSMDADTRYPSGYLLELATWFRSHPHHLGLSLPYFHVLTGNPEHDRLILRYEIYMRHYALNMIRIQNPYRFTALGSAMAFPVWAYRKVGGLTPVPGGEDFYFLQKLVKTGPIGYTASATAYPSSRFSDRVHFGTGPALIKGRKGQWDAYPFYPETLFEKVKETFHRFPALFEHDMATPMDSFLKQTFKTDDLWGPLRKNFKDPIHFAKACTGKVDGLRILQFLKTNFPGKGSEVKPLTAFLQNHFPQTLTEKEMEELESKGFERADLMLLIRLRQRLYFIENAQRRQG